MHEASAKAMAQLRGEWDACSCAVCGTEKWPHHPFCRSCSIRLQRARLMQPLTPFAGESIAELDARFARHCQEFADRIWLRWLILYDLCRDFLIVTRRSPVSRRRGVEVELG